MKFKKILAFVLLSVMILSTLSACTSDSGSDIGGEGLTPDENISSEEVPSIAPFVTKTVEGDEFSDADFSEYDLIMVNFFATWCTPCVNEIPDIAKIAKEVKDDGVLIIGVVSDMSESFRSPQTSEEDVIKIAKRIKELSVAEYPFIAPDETLFNGRLASIDAVPETFFVDKEGRLVGGTYVGARSYDGWMNVIEKELEKVRSAAE